jgi:hypothetical protein
VRPEHDGYFEGRLHPADLLASLVQREEQRALDAAVETVSGAQGDDHSVDQFGLLVRAERAGLAEQEEVLGAELYRDGRNFNGGLFSHAPCPVSLAIRPCVLTAR